MLRVRSVALLPALLVALVTAHSAACIANPFVAASGDDASVGSGDGAPVVVSNPGESSDDAREEVASCDGQSRPSDSGCLLANGSGAFVAPAANGGDDGAGDGTREHPYATIGFALAHLAGTTRVYACDGDYVESVTMTSAGANLYGALVCPNGDAGAAWTYVEGGHATVTAPAGSYALHVTDIAGAIEIQDMAFVAPDATGTDATGNGSSSVAVFVKGSSVAFTRATITAGAGATGSDGTSAASDPNYVGSNAGTGSAGTAPADAGVDASTGAGAGGSTSCLLYGSSLGGSGGGAATSTAPGGDGGTGSSMIWADASSTYSPPPGMQPQGLGGPGDPAGACGPGGHGADGFPGPCGVGATSFGAVNASGWVPASGGSGQPGGPGQGGGGGGGRGLPPSGGNGGGAGGCGGSGGGGGHGGGGSIAIAAFASTVTIGDCALTTGNAGNGGDGAAGQPGQAGGPSKDLDAGACSGGLGGNGAGGSGGAGGAQGVSVDVILDSTSSLVMSEGSLDFCSGRRRAAGDGGKGGAHGGGPSSMGQGQDGIAGSRGYGDVLGVGSVLRL